MPTAAGLSDFISGILPFWLVPVGLGLLYIYGLNHFNTPEYALSRLRNGGDAGRPTDVRKSHLAQLRTTAPPSFTVPRERYRRHARFYIYILWSVFLAITLVPDLFGYAAAQLSGTELDLPASVSERAIWGLFLLTGLLSSFPGLRDGDHRLLQYLHRRAEIPDDARDTADQLFRADFGTESSGFGKTQADLGDEFVRAGEAGRFRGVLESQWAQCHTLWRCLNDLIRGRQYRVFRRRFDEDIDETEEIYGLKKQQIEEYKNNERQHVAASVGDIDKYLRDQDSEELRKLRDYRAELEADIESFFYRLCILSSLLAYSCEPTRDRIDARFNQLGFKVKVSPLPRLDLDTLLKTCLAVFVAIIVPSAIYGVFANGMDRAGFDDFVPDSGKMATLWSLSGVILYGVSIFIAIFLKRTFARRRRDKGAADTHDRRFTHNFVIAVVAAVIGYFISLVLSLFLTQQIDWTSPWSLGNGVTAYFVAVYIDRTVDNRRVDALLIAAHAFAMALSALVCTFFSMVTDFAGWPPIVTVFGTFAILTFTLIGLSVGILFPRAYRQGFGSDATGASGGGGRRVSLKTVLVPVDDDGPTELAA